MFSRNDFFLLCSSQWVLTLYLKGTIITSTIINSLLCTKLMTSQEDFRFHFVGSTPPKTLQSYCWNYVYSSTFPLWFPSGYCTFAISFMKNKCVAIICFRISNLIKLYNKSMSSGGFRGSYCGSYAWHVYSIVTQLSFSHSMKAWYW